ncbi:hypothetical protein AS188_04050 [Kocuria flava]|uniref:Uncharacterized protein n=1 Tax=Kocuria flava TaxID=446860 RepID=A0A0U2XL35_9MICC|nr:hypothetical protein AS188_04050 [Kocuria flava]
MAARDPGERPADEGIGPGVPGDVHEGGRFQSLRAQQLARLDPHLPDVLQGPPEALVVPGGIGRDPCARLRRGRLHGVGPGATLVLDAHAGPSLGRPRSTVGHLTRETILLGAARRRPESSGRRLAVTSGAAARRTRYSAPFSHGPVIA